VLGRPGDEQALITTMQKETKQTEGLEEAGICCLIQITNVGSISGKTPKNQQLKFTWM